MRLIPNAVDGAHFAEPRSRPVDLPPAPTAVYVGTLHEDRLDVELVAELAERRPDLHVVLVGPDSLGTASVDRLRRCANVHLLGAKPYEDVPAYLQHADVVVVPHVVSPFTESLDPIKAYECLAVDRPTVATPVAGFRELDDVFRIGDRDGFTDAVQAALVDGTEPAPRCVPSWEHRAEQFAATLAAARAAARSGGPE